MDDKNAVRKIISLVVILSLFFIVLTCLYQVRTTESAVLTTFEKPVAAIDSPGLHFKYPWPIQKAYIFDRRTKTYQSPYMEFLVKDGFNVVVRVFAFWSIDDAGLYKNKVGVTDSKGEQIISNLVSKHLKNYLGSCGLSELVTTESANGKGLGAFENEILAKISEEALPEYGIKVSLFGFDRLELPEETTKSVFERMKSERMKSVEKIKYEGEYKAQSIKTEANLEKNKIIAEAEAKAAKTRGEAEAKAFECLDVYRQNPQLALFLKKLDALEYSMKSKTTLILDKSTPPFDMLGSDAIDGLEIQEPKTEKQK